MKFVIVGTGGTGGVLGAYLAKAGNDVTFIARGKHLAAMQEKGLTLETKHNGIININPCRAVTMEEYNDTPDAMLVCVKYYNIQDAIEFARRTAGPETVIIPILNVVGTGEVINDAIPERTALDGCMYVLGKIKEPGTVEQVQKILRVFFGFRKNQDRTLLPKVLEIEQLMNEAGIETHYTENIVRDALQKFSFVSPMGAACIYFNALSEDFQQEGEVRETFIGLIREVQALGKAMGIETDKDWVQLGLKLIDAYGPGIGTSMSRDVDAGNASEFAGLVTRMVELGTKYNVPVPLYSKINDWGKAKGL